MVYPVDFRTYWFVYDSYLFSRNYWIAFGNGFPKYEWQQLQFLGIANIFYTIPAISL